MKIFEEKLGVIRLQLMDLKKNKMLFNFTIEKLDFPELRDHIIEYLEKYEMKES